MTTVKFTSLDKEKREVTMNVGGVAVTRSIPAQFKGTIDDYLAALAKGLANEGSVEPKVIETTKAKSGDVLIATPIIK